MDKSIVDTLLSDHAFTCSVESITVTPDEIVHVVGAQEPVRNQPDSRARMLLDAGWLKIELIKATSSESERSKLVTTIQQAARAWLRQPDPGRDAAQREQVRWMVEKTRSHESNQQIAQRIWLTVVLYSSGCRGLRFNQEGEIHWDGGFTGRIGLAPDDLLDLAWSQDSRQIYAGSFRQPDGTITRGKGRRRWYTYRLAVDPAAAFLFERRSVQGQQSVALIVASEIHATQPQLPRDFYGGDAFQQACIDAQDQHFDHIFVLSPEHGVISLDDTVPSDKFWDDVLDRGVWGWQARAVQRLGAYLFDHPSTSAPDRKNLNYWSWLNPESVYVLTVFGGGFAVQVLLDHLILGRSRLPAGGPQLKIAERRPGYDVGEMDDDLDFDFDLPADLDFSDQPSLEAALQDIDQLLEWATEFVSLITIFVPPTGETWELAPDEALIPIRLLAEIGMEVEDMLDLLTDVTLLLEHPLPFSMLINTHVVVSVLLQITHSLVHGERDSIQESLDVFPDGVLRQYVENALQEPRQEDQLCACLTLAEQMQLVALSIPPALSDQLLIWLQTYLSFRLRKRILGESDDL